MRYSAPLTRWRSRLAGPRAWAVAAAAVTALGLAVAALAGAFSAGPVSRPSSLRNAALSQPVSPRGGQPGGHQPAGAAPAGQSRQARTTSCTSVAHIGDSTSVGLVDPAVLPNPAQRLPAQYRAVGVQHVQIDASGGRSVVEEMPGQVNGYLTARGMASHGFRGCWVFALGTNDTANVAAGSMASRAARIAEMMSVAHGQPVLWVNTRTLDSSGAWSEASMRLWNDALQQACARYPNMRIFDWASAAQPGWYQADGIHYTSAGYAARGKAIAGGLAAAFPAGGHSRGCLVR